MKRVHHFLQAFLQPGGWTSGVCPLFFDFSGTLYGEAVPWRTRLTTLDIGSICVSNRLFGSLVNVSRSPTARSHLNELTPSNFCLRKAEELIAGHHVGITPPWGPTLAANWILLLWQLSWNASPERGALKTRIKCSLSRQNLGGGRVCEGGGEDPGWPSGSATEWLGEGREMQDSEREGEILIPEFLTLGSLHVSMMLGALVYKFHVLVMAWTG